MEKIDFEDSKPLYDPPVGEFASVEVPQMQFVKVDGKAIQHRSSLPFGR